MFADTAGIVSFARVAGFATVAGIATFAEISGFSTFSGRSAFSTYADLAGISTVAFAASFAEAGAGLATIAGFATDAGVAGFATFAGRAGVTTFIETVETLTDQDFFIPFVENSVSTGIETVRVDGGLRYNPSTNKVTIDGELELNCCSQGCKQCSCKSRSWSNRL